MSGVWTNVGRWRCMWHMLVMLVNRRQVALRDHGSPGGAATMNGRYCKRQSYSFSRSAIKTNADQPRSAGYDSDRAGRGKLCDLLRGLAAAARYRSVVGQ